MARLSTIPAPLALVSSLRPSESPARLTCWMPGDPLNASQQHVVALCEREGWPVLWSFVANMAENPPSPEIAASYDVPVTPATPVTPAVSSAQAQPSQPTCCVLVRDGYPLAILDKDEQQVGSVRAAAELLGPGFSVWVLEAEYSSDPLWHREGLEFCEQQLARESAPQSSVRAALRLVDGQGAPEGEGAPQAEPAREPARPNLRLVRDQDQL